MLKSLREFKKPAFLTLALMVVEVLIDVLIPFYTADLVNRVKAGVPMNEVLVPGLILVLMALLSLLYLLIYMDIHIRIRVQADRSG